MYSCNFYRKDAKKQSCKEIQKRKVDTILCLNNSIHYIPHFASLRLCDFAVEIAHEYIVKYYFA